MTATNPAVEARIGWRQTRRLLWADLRRRLELEQRRTTPVSVLELLLHRGAWAVIFFRINTWLHGCGLRKLARIGELLGTLVGKSELHVGARIGPGLVISDLGGVGIPRFAVIDANCTFLGPSLLTLGAMSGVDLERDRIVLGRHCVIGQGARLLGAITLGDGTQVKPNAVVITSFAKPGQILGGIPARRRGTVELAALIGWSPLSPRPAERGRIAEGLRS